MRMNLPITGKEKNLPAGAMLVSRTDAKGVITYANDAFVDISGFSREELIGSGHNISRHPDVRSAVFEDMWHTLKKGLPWRGIVKNRCKDSDHYWVDAQAVPVRRTAKPSAICRCAANRCVKMLPGRRPLIRRPRVEEMRSGNAYAGAGKGSFREKWRGHRDRFRYVADDRGRCPWYFRPAPVSTAMRTHHYEEMGPVQAIIEQGLRVATLEWSASDAVHLASGANAGHGRIVRTAMPADAVAYGQRLYATLRQLDTAHFDRLLAEAPPATAAWLAVADRLRRASYRD